MLEREVMTEKPITAEELQELLNGEDFYELLRKTTDPEAQAYIDKIWMNAIYKDT
jgi:hypothetical protein